MSTIDPLGRASKITADAPSDPPHVTALRDSLTALISESQALRTDVRSAEMARRRASQINLGLLATLGIFVALLIAVTWQNNRLAVQVAETNRRMADCTAAGGKCYEEGRKRTSNAIQDILKVNIYMAECARLYPGESGPEFDKKLEACIYTRLSKATKERQAAPAPSASSSG